MKLKVCLIFIGVSFNHLVYAEEILTSAYGKLLALSSTSDISALTLEDEGFLYSKYTLPYSFDDLYINGNYSFSLDTQFNYFTVNNKEDIKFNDGVFKPKWDIFNIVLAPRVSYKLNENFTLNGTLEYGYSKMRNKSKFEGDGENLLNIVELKFVDWNINAVHITPHVNLNYNKKLKNHDDLIIKSSIGYIILSNFNKNDSDPDIGNKIGTWSVEGEYIINDAFNVFGRSIDISLANNIGGFYGKNYRDLNFGFVNTSSFSLKTPVKIFGNNYKLKTGAGYLINDYAHGMMFILKLE